jgi:hypothetical protein
VAARLRDAGRRLRRPTPYAPLEQAPSVRHVVWTGGHGHVGQARPPPLVADQRAVPPHFASTGMPMMVIYTPAHGRLGAVHVRAGSWSNRGVKARRRPTVQWVTDMG